MAANRFVLPINPFLFIAQTQTSVDKSRTVKDGVKVNDRPVFSLLESPAKADAGFDRYKPSSDIYISHWK
jgi:hypothetical protein